MTTLQTTIAGVTFEHRQGYLNYIKQSNRKDIKVYLRREPKNKFDPNAIRVCARNIKTKKYADCGYIPAELAKTLAPLMDNGIFINATNYQVTGLSQTTLGMTVTLSYR